MANKDHDLDLDKDFDDDLDLPDLDLDDVDSDPSNRTPIDRASKGFTEGIKQSALSRSTQKKLIENGLPKGYGSAFNMATDAADAAEDLYDTAAENLRPAMRDAKKIGRKVREKASPYLPKWLDDKLDQWTKEDNDHKRLDSYDPDENEINTTLASIFQSEQEQKAQDDAERRTEQQTDRVLEDARHVENKSQLAHIQDAIGRIVGYQEDIASRFQKKSLELQYRQYFIARDQFSLLKQYAEESGQSLVDIRKNTSLPDFLKLRGSERIQEMLRDKTLGKIGDSLYDFSNNFAGNLFENLKDKVASTTAGIADGLRDASDMMSQTDGDIDAMELLGNVGGSEATEWLAGRAGRLLSRFTNDSDTLTRVGADLGYYAQGGTDMAAQSAVDKVDSRLEQLRKEIERKELDGESVSLREKAELSLLENLSNLVPRFTEEGQFGMSSEKLAEEAALYTELTDRTITETIPGLLSEILREAEMIRTGSVDVDRQIYDFDRGAVVRESQLQDDIRQKIVDSGDVRGLQDKVNKVIELLDSERSLDGETRAKLADQLEKDIFQNKAFTIENFASKDNLDMLSDAQATEVSNLVNRRYMDGGRLKKDRDASVMRRDAAQLYNSAKRGVPNYKETIARNARVYGAGILDRAGLSEFTGKSGIHETRAAEVRNIFNTVTDGKVVRGDYSSGRRNVLDEISNLDTAPQIEIPIQDESKWQNLIDGAKQWVEPYLQSMWETMDESKAFIEGIYDFLIERFGGNDNTPPSGGGPSGPSSWDRVIGPMPLPPGPMPYTSPWDRDLGRFSGGVGYVPSNAGEDLSGSGYAWGSKAGDLFNAMRDKFNVAKDKVTSGEYTSDDLIARLKTFGETTKDRATATAGNLGQRFNEFDLDGLIGSMRGTFERVKGRAVDTFDSVSSDVNDRFLDRGIDIVKLSKEGHDYVRELYEAAAEKGKPYVEELNKHLEVLDSYSKRKLEEVKSGVSMDDIKSKIPNVSLQDIKDGIANVDLDRLKGSVQNNDSFTALKDSSKSKVEQLRTYLMSEFGNARGQVDEIISSLRESDVEPEKVDELTNTAKFKAAFDRLLTGVKFGGSDGVPPTGNIPPGGEPPRDDKYNDDEPYRPWLDELKAHMDVKTTMLVEAIAMIDTSKPGAIRSTLSKMVSGASSLSSGLMSYYGKTFSGIGSLIKAGGEAGGNVLGGLFGRRSKDPASSDIYLEGVSEPIILGRDLKRGVYSSLETGEPIYSFEDIDGAIVDADGNVVVTSEDIAEDRLYVVQNNKPKLLKGLLGRGAKALQGLFGGYLDGARAIQKTIFNVTRKIGGYLPGLLFGKEKAKTTNDIYVKGESEPRLRAIIMKTGGYISAETGEAIRFTQDIDGEVLDLDGNVILSHDDIKTGLVDAKGNDIDLSVGKTDGLVKSAMKFAKKGLDVAYDVTAASFKATKDLVTGAGRYVGGLFGGQFGGKLKGENAERLLSDSEKQVSLLTEIRDLIDSRVNPPDAFFDQDGDGFRDGGWRSKLYGDKSKEEDESKTTKSKDEGANTDSSLLKKLGGMFGGLLGGGDDGDGDNYYVDTGGDMSRDTDGKDKKSKPKSKMGRMWQGIKNIGSKVGGALGLGTAATALKGAGSFLWNNVVRSGTAWAARGLWALGSAAVGILGAPVALAVGAAAAVGAGAYFLYKYADQADLDDINRVRYTQYGADLENDEHVGMMYKLENYLQDYVTMSDGKTPALSGIDPKDLLDELGLEPEEHEAQIERFYRWFNDRFKPVYLSWIAASRPYMSDFDLEDAEDQLEVSEKIQVLKRSKYDDNGDSPYRKMTSPFESESGIVGFTQVDNIYNEILTNLESQVGEVDKPTIKETVVVPVAVEEEKVLTVSDRLRDMASKENDPILKRGLLSKAKQMENVTGPSRSISTTMTMEDGKLTIEVDSDAILPSASLVDDPVGKTRMVAYGVKSPDETEKVQHLLKLEKAVTPLMRNVNGRMAFKGSRDVLYADHAYLFGRDKSSDSDKMIWTEWFNKRFIPVLATYIGAMDSNKGLFYNPMALKDGAAYSVAEKLRSAINGIQMSIWTVVTSPWPGYAMSNNSSAVRPYLSDLLSKRGKTTKPSIEKGRRDFGQDITERGRLGGEVADNYQSDEQMYRDFKSPGYKPSDDKSDDIIIRPDGGLDDRHVEADHAKRVMERDLRRQEKSMAIASAQSQMHSAKLTENTNRMISILNQSVDVQRNMASKLTEISEYLQNNSDRKAEVEAKAREEAKKKPKQRQNTSRKEEVKPTVNMKR